MRYCVFLLLLAGFSFCSCHEADYAIEDKQGAVTKKEMLRIGMVTGLKPDKIDYYKELHANTWEGVLKKLKECNIRNYSIYFKKIEDKYYLFSYFEYTGNNYLLDMKKIAADSTTQRWWRETDPCQQPLPEAAAAGEIWSPMEEVFYME